MLFFSLRKRVVQHTRNTNETKLISEIPTLTGTGICEIRNGLKLLMHAASVGRHSGINLKFSH